MFRLSGCCPKCSAPLESKHPESTRSFRDIVCSKCDWTAAAYRNKSAEVGQDETLFSQPPIKTERQPRAQFLQSDQFRTETSVNRCPKCDSNFTLHYYRAEKTPYRTTCQKCGTSFAAGQRKGEPAK